MEEYGIPGIVLMENAGIRLADEVLKLTGDRKNRVVLIAGKEIMAVTYWWRLGTCSTKAYPFRVFLVGASSGMAGRCRVNAGILIE